MAFKADQSDEIMSEINVVPLVDVILVVLIIFMVTAPMIMKPSINVNLPKAASGEATTPSKLNITISNDGKLNLDGQMVEDAQVQAKAQEEVGKNPEIQAIISADKDVPHGRVVSVLDIVKGAGVKKFAISIDKK
ncbi:ExbD/TolR family protein [Pseudobdellovibrio sp. HCB154]|uniref:ExbD/TolR family protein n=1 Tax=Pseudobdellovibrio sp. HCB154 TaxID=3386277 RepID=UPI003916E87C